MKITVSGARVQKHFQYEWERKIDQLYIDGAITGSDFDLDIAQNNELRVIGLILANEDSEGCALMHSDFEARGILDADILLDAIGDLERLRQQALGPRDG